MVIWLRMGQEAVGLDHGIVRAEEVQTLMGAHFVLGAAHARWTQGVEAARREAEAIVEHARQQADAVLAEGRSQAQAAIDQGYDEGMRAAVADWHVGQIQRSRTSAEKLRATQAKLAEIVTVAVERIVQSGPREALFQRALKSVQTLALDAAKVTLRVSPADHAHASAALHGAIDGDDATHQVELQVDSGLRPGSCVFESAHGILDASLQTQLEGLRAAMQRAVRQALARADDAPEALPGHGVEAPEPPMAADFLGFGPTEGPLDGPLHGPASASPDPFGARDP